MVFHDEHCLFSHFVKCSRHTYKKSYLLNLSEFFALLYSTFLSSLPFFGGNIAGSWSTMKGIVLRDTSWWFAPQFGYWELFSNFFQPSIYSIFNICHEVDRSTLFIRNAPRTFDLTKHLSKKLLLTLPRRICAILASHPLQSGGFGLFEPEGHGRVINLKVQNRPMLSFQRSVRFRRPMFQIFVYCKTGTETSLISFAQAYCS